MRTLFVYNPHAGMMQIKNHLYDILNIFAEAGYEMTVVPTRQAGDASAHIKKHLSSYELVICSGGDGTLNEVINGMLNTKMEELPPLGYIPAGSTNDFANSLKLPKNMQNAAKLIVEGVPVPYDVGKFNNKYFSYIAAFGAFTSVSYGTPQDTKNVLGHFAYMLEGLRSLTEIKSYKIKVKVNDEIIEGNYIYGMVTNTLSVGGLYKLDHRKVKLDDGQLEVMLIKEPKDPLEFNDITSFLLGTIKETPMVFTCKTNRISIETDDEMPWTLDGEYGGAPNKVLIKDIEKAIHIINK